MKITVQSSFAKRMEREAVSSVDAVSYRITGPQSIERLDPLLKSIEGLKWTRTNDSTSSLHFVWETSCKKSERNQHTESVVCNRLHNSQIVEDKSNLAFLQVQMATADASVVLETYVTRDLAGVANWFGNRWGQKGEETRDIIRSRNSNPSVSCNGDWWIVKASKGNGGRDVWVVHPDNSSDVLSLLPPNEGQLSYVEIQRENLNNFFLKVTFLVVNKSCPSHITETFLTRFIKLLEVHFLRQFECYQVFLLILNTSEINLIFLVSLRRVRHPTVHKRSYALERS